MKNEVLMQTGIFYVRLKAEIDPKEFRVERSGKTVFVGELLTTGRPYPVLAVEYVRGSDAAYTLYHIPTDDNTIEWMSADLFVFARD